MFYNKIRQIEIELTTRCNAACPQCSRNFYGSNVWPTLPIADLDLNLIKSSIPDSILEDLVEIRVCGTFGDPCVYKNLIEFVEYINTKSKGQLTINTNGSIRSKEWWKKLASVLKPDDRVIFGIDGLQDTNHLYRINTNFDKIIENATAFINAGGSAIWSYIVFKHNQHQVEEAKRLSEKLGFDGFAFKKTSRFVNKQHEFVEKTPVYGKLNNIIRYLEMPTDERYLNDGYKDHNNIISEFGTYKNYLKETEIFCIAQHSGLVNITAEGLVLPCGWLYDRLYGYEVENHPDRNKLIELIENNGGFDSISLHKYNLSEIVTNKVFLAIRDDWINSNRMERCANQCGKYGMLKHATKELQKYVKGEVSTEINLSQL